MNNYQIDVWENYKQAGYQNFENILLAIKEGKFKSEITEIRNSLKVIFMKLLDPFCNNPNL